MILIRIEAEKKLFFRNGFNTDSNRQDLEKYPNTYYAQEVGIKAIILHTDSFYNNKC